MSERLRIILTKTLTGRFRLREGEKSVTLKRIAKKVANWKGKFGVTMETMYISLDTPLSDIRIKPGECSWSREHA